MVSAAVDAADFLTMVGEEFCVAELTPPLFDVMGFANALSAMIRLTESFGGSSDVGLDGGAGRRRAPSSSAKRSADDFVRR